MQFLGSNWKVQVGGVGGVHLHSQFLHIYSNMTRQTLSAMQPMLNSLFSEINF